MSDSSWKTLYSQYYYYFVRHYNSHKFVSFTQIVLCNFSRCPKKTIYPCPWTSNTLINRKLFILYSLISKYASIISHQKIVGKTIVRKTYHISVGIFTWDVGQRRLGAQWVPWRRSPQRCCARGPKVGGTPLVHWRNRVQALEVWGIVSLRKLLRLYHIKLGLLL